MVRLYCFLRLNLNTSTLSPRPCPTIVPFTFADPRPSPVTSSLLSRTSVSTRPSSTSAPTSPASVSTLITSPGATRNCFPPASMTAYIIVLLPVERERPRSTPGATPRPSERQPVNHYDTTALAAAATAVPGAVRDRCQAAERVSDARQYGPATIPMEIGPCAP